MNKARFFALLHFARELYEPSKILRRIALNTFLIGYNAGWNAKI